MTILSSRTLAGFQDADPTIFVVGLALAAALTVATLILVDKVSK